MSRILPQEQDLLVNHNYCSNYNYTTITTTTITIMTMTTTIIANHDLFVIAAAWFVN